MTWVLPDGDPGEPLKYLDRRQDHGHTMPDLQKGPDSSGSQENVGDTLAQHGRTHQVPSMATSDTDQNLLLTTQGTGAKHLPANDSKAPSK